MITPDRFAILHYKEEDSHAILSGWGGGYLSADEWRRSSAIQSVEMEGNDYIVQTGSSVYRLRDGCEGVTGLSASIWGQINREQERLGKDLVDIYICEEDVADILNKYMK